MAEIKYDKLDRIRADIQKDRDKVLKLQEQIKAKEAKLKEAEATQIVSDVEAMNLSPEQLGEFLALIQTGQLAELLGGKYGSPIRVVNQMTATLEQKENEENKEESEDD